MNTETSTESNIIIKTLNNIYNSLFSSTSNDIHIVSRNELLTNNLYNETEHAPVPNYIPSRNDLLGTETFNSFMQNGGRNDIVRGIRPLNNIIDNSDKNLKIIVFIVITVFEKCYHVLFYILIYLIYRWSLLSQYF